MLYSDGEARMSREFFYHESMILGGIPVESNNCSLLRRRGLSQPVVVHLLLVCPGNGKNFDKTSDQVIQCSSLNWNVGFVATSLSLTGDSLLSTLSKI